MPYRMHRTYGTTHIPNVPTAATDMAEMEAKDGEQHWVFNHLTALLYSHNFATEPDSAEARIAELLKDIVFANKKDFAYEWCLLRVMVQ